MENTSLVNLNGRIIPGDKPIFTAYNRGFRYGDGLFESIRMINGKMPLMHLHYPRLQGGCNLLKLKLPEHFTSEYFEEQILKLTNEKGISENARIRLTIYRANGGLYLPSNNTTEFIIESEPLTEKIFRMNKNGLNIDIYPEIEKPTSKFSNYKTCNALIYVLASIYKAEHNLDDCMLLNWKGRVIETINSNIFLMKEGECYTPPLAEGCINGVMRMFMVELLSDMKITLHEAPLTLEELFNVDEFMITNAIYGIRWVEKYKSKVYGKSIAEKLSAALNKKLVGKE